jgi:hypothetical protein
LCSGAQGVHFFVHDYFHASAESEKNALTVVLPRIVGILI